MRQRRKRISRYLRATIARSRSSTLESQKSSSNSSTETPQESSSSNKQGSKYGSSLRKGFVKGIYVSTKTGRRELYDSSYELRRFKALDSSPLVEDWGRPKLKIGYRLGKRKRKYHPDILVKYYDGRIFLEEVKGYLPSKIIFLKKNQRAKIFCRSKGWEFRIIWEKDLETLF